MPCPSGNCVPDDPMNRTSYPMSTRLNTLGSYFLVDGDYDDKFMVFVQWDSTVLLYAVDCEGTLTYIEEYMNVKHLVEKQPGFAIICPTNSNERYLPNYCVKPLRNKPL